MKLLSVFRKSMREQLRDRLSLALTLLGAPFFVFLYWLMLQSGTATYRVLILPEEPRVMQVLNGWTYEDGTAMIKATAVTNRAEAEQRLRNRDADALVILDPGFGGNSSRLTLVGDLTSQRYMVTAIVAMTALEGYVKEATGQLPLVQMNEEALGQSGARSDFEASVPGLLMVAVMMLMFKVALVLTAEVEAGTLRRLQLSRMTALDLLGGITLSQLLTGVAAVLVTFGVSVALGFRSNGPLWVAMVVTSLSTFSMVGFGLLTACFSRTATEASVAITFPMLTLMFFSGAAFPLPKVPLFAVGSRMIGLYDFLPPTHGVVALNKVLTLGAGLGDIVYELVALSALSVLTFALGVWLFHRRHMLVR